MLNRRTNANCSSLHGTIYRAYGLTTLDQWFGFVVTVTSQHRLLRAVFHTAVAFCKRSKLIAAAILAKLIQKYLAGNIGWCMQGCYVWTPTIKVPDNAEVRDNKGRDFHSSKFVMHVPDVEPWQRRLRLPARSQWLLGSCYFKLGNP